MSKNCALCNQGLVAIELEGGVCHVCDQVHNGVRMPTKAWGHKAIGTPRTPKNPQYILQIGDIVKEGYECTYCEDVFAIDDMNNTIGRWLCNQCFIEHVLQE